MQNTKNVWEKSNDAYSLSIRVESKINYTSIFFYHRARAEKGIARHIDVSSVVWTLFRHGKLANQIARLAVKPGKGIEGFSRTRDLFDTRIVCA